VTGKRRAIASLLLSVFLAGCVTPGTIPTSFPTSAPSVGELVSAVTTLGAAVMPIGEKEEIRIGRAMAANVAGRYGVVRDWGLTRYVSMVGETVARKSDRPDLAYHFAVLDTDIINAFSCPGGYVFVTRGTLASIRSEAELAAVLAHEVCHVAKKHIVKEIEKQKFFAAGNEVAGNLLDTDPALFNTVTSFGTNLLFKGLSRSDEYQADSLALDYVAAAGYDPNGLLTFLERLRSEGVASNPEGLKLLSATHPQIDDRITRARSIVDKMADQQKNGRLLIERYEGQVRPGAGIR
jgi:predicted Zn-dependent protease